MRGLLALGLPALLIGVGASLVILGIIAVADQLQDLLWNDLPSALGASAGSWWWIVLMLTATGVAVGAVVAFAPGHAGPDPATESMVAPPLPLAVLPSLVLALVIGLAGGVSLGPENPITAINIALVVALGTRLVPGVAATTWVMLAAAGTIGALFGTPVAAALILSEMIATSGGAAASPVPLWDRLFAPLVAAGAGALTTTILEQPSFAVPVTPYRGVEAVDLLSGSLVVVAAVGLGLVGLWAFPRAHRLFHELPHPVLMLGAGGLVLGILGALGGEITLFKGLAEMKELTATAATYDAGGLLLIVVVKLAALVVAATCGFLGGRIFPAVFIGVSLGLLAHELVGGVPEALAVSCAVLGVVLVVTQSGWLSIFMAAAIVPDLRLLPVLCVVVLPAWLLVSGRPEMLIRRPS